MIAITDSTTSPSIRNNRVPLLLHIAIILTLLGISVWDSILIINTFVNDNQLTLVRTEIGNDSSPFLENISINAFYYSSVLPKSWLLESNISDLRASEQYRDVLADMQAGNLSLDSIDGATFDGVITAVPLFSQLAHLDYVGYQCLGSIDNEFCDTNAFTENYSLILRNVTRLETLENDVFSRLKTNFFGAISFDKPRVNRSLAIHGVGDLTGLYAEVDPIGLMERFSNGIHFAMRLIDDPPNFRLDDSRLSYAAIDIYEKQRFLVQVQAEPKSWYRIFVMAKNLGIYDKTVTRADCTRDPEIYSNIGNPSNYDSRDYLKSIVSKCGCVPFTQRKHFRKFEASQSADAQNLQFCDYQKYCQCKSTNGPIVINDDEFPPSCVIVRNQYIVSTTQRVCNQDMCPYMDFEIISADHSYVIYKDQYILTTTQFISQLGGDIGLYTGLSLLSVWQLIVFVHKRHKRYGEDWKVKRGGERKKDGYYYRGFIGELFKETETYFGGKERRKTASGEVVETEKAHVKELRSTVEEDEAGGVYLGRVRPQEVEEADVETGQVSNKSVKENIGGSDRLMEERMRKLETKSDRMESKLDEIMGLIRNIVSNGGTGEDVRVSDL